MIRWKFLCIDASDLIGPIVFGYPLPCTSLFTIANPVDDPDASPTSDAPYPHAFILKDIAKIFVVVQATSNIVTITGHLDLDTRHRDL